ncbi:hypothetical protein R1flu_008474 [Riccia fluitans]|uniref:Ubiquitin-like protease family profile domain-containing protein n=1 Tax=Riccia fluitans TaxID=41844 RepID=A0ABD1YFE0_9MARC
MFYMNTFKFTKASELVARYDKTNHVEEPMIKITRLRKSICPEFHEEDMQGNLPTWIFVPIHGKNHWSLAIIRLHNDVAMLAHLDSFRGTHDPKALFHVFKTVLCLIVPIDPALIMTAIMNVEQQQIDIRVESTYCKCSLMPPRRSQTDWIDVLERRCLLDI